MGIAWPPSESAHIHTHGEECWGKWIEGELQITDFRRLDDSRLEVVGHRDFSKTDVEFMPADSTLHRLKNAGTVPAIHLHFYGPRKEVEAVRYETVYPIDLDHVAPGTILEVSTCGEVLPSNTLSAWTPELDETPHREEEK